MAYRVVPDRQGVINIGKIKENLVTEVELPAPGFGGGSYAVLLRRPKEEQPYPVAARHEGSTLIWTVQTADTAIAGTGKLECRWYGDNGEVAKSQTYMVRITDGLPDPTEAPEAWEGFMGQVARDAQAAKDAAGEAKANADGAAASAGIAQGAATEAWKQARAAGEAANGAAAAASAASSAQAGAESAQRNAKAAAEAAETARSGAEAAELAAGESATGAAGSAEAAAQAAQKGENLYNQVKDDLAAGKLKGEKGDPGPAGPAGKDGLDAPQIDDAVVSAENPWSSKKIIETLCPPLEATGNPVTCDPVAGYPLGVVASWEPIQAGEGDPSPDNIRPIKGRDSVTVERCGENLIKYPAAGKTNGIEITVDGSKLTVKGTCPSGTSIKSDAVYCPDGKYTLSSDVLIPAGAYISAYIKIEKLLLNKDHRNATGKLSGNVQMLLYLEAGTYDFAVQVSLVPGTTAPSAYTPYRGDTLALVLPSTIYGGTVDAVTGEGAETWKLVTLDGTEAWNSWGVDFRVNGHTGFYLYAVNDYSAAENASAISSHYKFSSGAHGGAQLGFGLADSKNKYLIISVANDALADTSSNDAAIKSFKAFLAAQYAAGTPVQIAYKLAEPVPFRATGNGPLLPIPGETNTIITDADSVTVTGRADPIRIIQQLQAAQSAAAAQLDETQQAMVDTTAMAVDYIYEQDSKIFGGDDDDSETDAVPT